ncbi:MAG TPA: RodZ domain-containing protein [Thermoleophilia bacterium]|nr:RodZ domain-containing protein [Thermoleophilia bacterium]
MFEIGNTLREARVRRKLTLQQVEEDTKIRVKYIQAMENEDFDVMPGATYVKGFLRTYAAYLGLDPDVVVDEYRSRGLGDREQQEPFGSSSVMGPPRSHRGRNAVLFVAVTCLLALGVIYALSLGDGTEGGTPATQPDPLGIASPSASAKPSPRPSKTAPAVVPGELRITAVGDAWVEVRRKGATGDPLFSGTIAKGKTRVYVGDVLWLRLGSPPNVRLRVEGRRIKTIEEAGPLDYVIENGKLKRQE